MLNHAYSSATIQRSNLEFAPETYWLQVALDELTGTDITMNGVDSGGAFSETIAVAGTTTNIWDPSGNFEGQGDNCTVFAKTPHDICRTDTLDGTILCMYFYGGNTAGTTGTDHTVSYGNPWTTMGWGARNLTGRKFQMGLAFAAGDVDAETAVDGSAYTDDAGKVEPLLMWMFRDPSVATTTSYGMYKGGVSIAEGTSEHAIYNANLRFAVFGRAQNTTGTPSTHVTALTLHSDIRIIRTPLDLRPHLGRISTEYAGSKWSKLLSLASLGV